MKRTKVMTREERFAKSYKRFEKECKRIEIMKIISEIGFWVPFSMLVILAGSLIVFTIVSLL